MQKTYYKNLTRLEMSVACNSGIFTAGDIRERENVEGYEASTAIKACLAAGVIRKVSWSKYKVC